MAQSVDPNQVIQELATELGKKNVELVMARIAISNLEEQVQELTGGSPTPPAADGT